MAAASQSKTSSEIRVIANDVVQQQAQICSLTMDAIKQDVSRLNDKMDTLTDTVTEIVTDVAVLKTRWQLFAITGGLVGVGGTLVGILVAIFK